MKPLRYFVAICGLLGCCVGVTSNAEETTTLGRSGDIATSSINGLQKMFHNSLLKAMGAGSLSEAPDKNDKDLEDTILLSQSEIFLTRGESTFTLSVHTSTPVPIEMKGFDVTGPNPRVITEADKLNGIDAKISYSINATAWRSYDQTHGWGEWKPGKPILLVSFELQRLNGRWKITSSPKSTYSLR